MKKALLLVGIACLGFGLYSIFRKGNTANVPNQITLQGNDSTWHSVGTGTFTLEVTGGIDYGGGNVAGPNGSLKMGDQTALVEGVPFGAVVARIGNSKPFLVGSSHKFNTSEQVFIAINDSYYDDNKGEYIITKR
jgi:hypothetical protein